MPGGEHDQPDGPDQPATFSARDMFADQPERGRERRTYKDDVELHFVFADHVRPANAFAIADALRGDDVIAVEAVGGSDETRSRHEHDLNEYMLLANDPGRARESAALLNSMFKNEFDRNLYSRLASYGPKNIVLIDIGSDDVGASELDEKAQTTGANIAYNILEGNNDIDLLRLMVVEDLVAQAQAHLEREHVATRQLEILSRQMSRHATDSSRVRIGVMAGSSHTAIQHAMQRDGFHTTRDFEDSVSNLMPGENTHFPPREQLIRRLKFSRDITLDPALVNRALLADYYTQLTLPASTSRDVVAEANAANQHLIDRMPDDDVSVLLSELGSVRIRDRAENRSATISLLESNRKKHELQT